MTRKINLPDIVLLLVSTLITIILALLAIRWFAPTLLGLPGDMVLVKSSKEAVPFYENIFDRKLSGSRDLLVDDPTVKIRGRPFTPNMGGVGPNDLLGFRNISIPHDADVITIGDSMTYGNNAYIWENWPHLLKFYLPEDKTIYSMATGGWGALQYIYAFAKSVYFKPRVAIIAFYTGNDPIDTYSLAQASNLWQEFVPKGINLKDYTLPKVEYPAPPGQQWKVAFPDDTGTVFTPALRNASNKKVKSIDIAYEIMVNVARKIHELGTRHHIRVFYTIIPTKEYVYSAKVRQSGIGLDAAYKRLIDNESYRIDAFARELDKISPGSYIDVAHRLMREVLKPVRLYPATVNGHPLPAGYGIIADEIGKKVSGVFDSRHIEGVYAGKTYNGLTLPVYINNNRFWIITGDTKGLAEKIGMSALPGLEIRELYRLTFGGFAGVKKVIEQYQAQTSP